MNEGAKRFEPDWDSEEEPDFLVGDGLPTSPVSPKIFLKRSFHKEFSPPARVEEARECFFPRSYYLLFEPAPDEMGAETPAGEAVVAFAGGVGRWGCGAALVISMLPLK